MTGDRSVWECELSLCVFFNDTATTEIYTLSLHDALPIFVRDAAGVRVALEDGRAVTAALLVGAEGRNSDRKSTRLNSSHANISYAVFCLKKKIHPTGCTELWEVRTEQLIFIYYSLPVQAE